MQSCAKSSHALFIVNGGARQHSPQPFYFPQKQDNINYYRGSEIIDFFFGEGHLP